MPTWAAAISPSSRAASLLTPASRFPLRQLLPLRGPAPDSLRWPTAQACKHTKCKEKILKDTVRVSSTSIKNEGEDGEMRFVRHFHAACWKASAHAHWTVLRTLSASWSLAPRLR